MPKRVVQGGKQGQTGRGLAGGEKSKGERTVGRVRKHVRKHVGETGGDLVVEVAEPVSAMG